MGKNTPWAVAVARAFGVPVDGGPTRGHVRNRRHHGGGEAKRSSRGAVHNAQTLLPRDVLHLAGVPGAGHLLLGIKVVREDDGEVPGLAGATIRTLLRIVDGIFSYLVAFITLLISGKNQRFGDMAAHTLVVRK